jgi:O-antigen ligase
MFQGDMKSNNVIKDSTIIEPKLDNFIGPKVDDFNAFTTGRLDKWKIASTHIIKSKIKNILFGNGPQFDRKIGDDLNRGDVANGILYVFLCGGLLGVFSFFLIIKKFLKIILYTFDNKKKLQADVYLCFSICCIISLTLRSLIENGYFVYGVDFLLITSSIFYLIKKLKLI